MAEALPEITRQEQDRQARLDHETEADVSAPVSVVTPSQGSQAKTQIRSEEPVPAANDRLMVSLDVAERSVYLFGWSRSDLRRAIALLLLAGITLYFLWLVQSILPPFLIAFFLAALLDPTLRYHAQRGRSRVRTILMIYLLTLSTAILALVILVPRVSTQLEDVTGNFSSYYDNIQKTTTQFLQKNEKTLVKLGLKRENLNQMFNQRSGPVKNAIAAVLGGITGFLTGIASKALWLVVIPIAGFFFMRDYPLLRARLIALWPEPYQDRVDVISREIVDVFSAYLRGLTKICALFGFAAFLILSFYGVPYALLLGMLAGLFYAIPYVGQLVTATVVGMVSYSMGAHTSLFFWHVEANSILFALTVVLSMIVMNNIFDQLVYPFVVGQSVGIHPVVNIFALSAGATLLGIWGMLLAVPVAASIQIVLMYCFPKLSKPPPQHLMEALKPEA